MIADSPYSMSAEELYFFDLRGYLVLPSVLTTAQRGACHEAFAHEGGGTADAGDGEVSGMLGWPAPYRDPFRELLVQPAVVSRLNEVCGSGFRLDESPTWIRRKGGTQGQPLHGAGQRGFDSGSWYHQQNGRIFCRAVTVVWPLTDAGPGDGGFAIIPGSHKSCEPQPAAVDFAFRLALQPLMKAGDALLFAETATHGWLPPASGKKEFQCLRYRFTSRGNARSVGRFFAPEERYGDWSDELTAAERAVLYGPGVDDVPRLESDGNRTWISATP